MVSNSFSEWSHVAARDPIMQGDILRAIHPAQGPWRQWMIVITADCDLAHAKYNGALSCISVLHHTDYLRIFRTERLAMPLRDRLTEDTLKIIKAGMVENGVEQVPDITPARLKSWMLEGAIETIPSALGLNEEKSKKIVDRVAAFRGITKEGPELGEFIGCLVQAKLVLNGNNNPDKAKSSVVKEMSSMLIGLPGDSMFINSISEEARDGYVAYLRRIHEIQDDELVTSIVSIPHDARYIRTGRLTAPYVYALTQQLANVFSSIGLPDEYEQHRAEALEIFSLIHLEQR